MTDKPCPPVAFDDFLKLDIRVGTVLRAEPFPQARKPALKLVIDFGEEIGLKTSSAQIVGNHSIDSLIGSQVLALINVPPRRIGPFVSQVLTLGLPDAAGAVMLIRPDRAVPDGGRLY
jgi:tRNA-binding protein